MLPNQPCGACPKCQASLASDDQFCPVCGVSMAREAERQAIYRALHVPALASGRRWLFAAGIFYLIGACLAIAMAHLEGTARTVVLGFGAGMFLIQLGLWWWAGRSHLAAAIVSLVLFGTIVGLDAVADPTTLAKGIVVKIILAVGLVRSVKIGLAARAAS
jgi:predicted nucleic acid-binding Zn ribbon protein